MRRPLCIVLLVAALATAYVPVQAQSPIESESGPGFQGASTCYDPSGHLTMWKGDRFERHHYANYYWLPNRQDNVTWTCERFEGGLEIRGPATDGTIYSKKDTATRYADNFGRILGVDTDIDGDGHRGASLYYERVIQDVGQGTHFVLHGWDRKDLYRLDFYDETGNRLAFYSHSEIWGDVIGEVPQDASHARVILQYPGYWEEPTETHREPRQKFDYYEVTFHGDELCPTGKPNYRATVSGYQDPHMELVDSGNLTPGSWLALNFSYAPGSPIMVQTKIHGADGTTVLASMKLQDGAPRWSHGNGGYDPVISWAGPSAPGIGTAIVAESPGGGEMGIDHRSQARAGYLSTYHASAIDYGLAPGNYSTVLFIYGGGNATLQQWKVWVDTCGTERTNVTGLSTGSNIEYIPPGEYQEKVDVQVATPGLQGWLGQHAWVTRGSVELEANESLFAMLFNPRSCQVKTWGKNLWEPRDDGARWGPVPDNTCIHSRWMEAGGPDGLRSWCFNRDREGGCLAVGPPGEYHIEFAYSGKDNYDRTPDGFYVLDIPWS